MRDRPESTEDEIEVTPEMIEALGDEFLRWYGENYNTLEGGGVGDVYDLLARLEDARMNFSSSSDSTERVRSNSSVALRNFST